MEDKTINWQIKIKNITFFVVFPDHKFMRKIVYLMVVKS
ncbi:hypothetical protein RINTHH_15820 [Richelia intracellularis HH01]|uniref:Uncharacterized protein n=1 Tax=Richelia intracellularis HH01 TaxID=1165094 RepID=M1WZN6_9NOST|nr:hypothetical protein RINTHH_15820 [Richelia intracellularis HH01]